MLYIAKNRTYQHQQINFIDGSARSVAPGAELEIDEFKIYKAEFERIKTKFNVSPVAFKDITPKRRVRGATGNVSDKEDN